ncbi:sigma-70 family RNA polymerase sigma factor [Candidatus Uhrbacteria bacterium]|nr:sigma-70 family RNA polymerase sigma factor [Candidatus Uhrbacteria bacterium]
MQTLREKFLLFRILRFRDKQAYGELYMEFAPRLRRYLTFRLPAPSDADDVLSDVFLKVWDYLTATPVDSISGLLFSVARNRISDFYRSRGRKETVSADLEGELFSSDAGVEAKHIENLADAEVVRRALKDLPEDQQAVVLLRYFDGLSVSEVADHLQKTENNVRVLTHRALRTLEERLSNP